MRRGRARAPPAAGRDVDPERPVRRRHAPARRDARLAHRRSASPPTARTTRTSAARNRAVWPRARGRSPRRASSFHPPASTRAHWRPSSCACGTRTSAAATCGRRRPRSGWLSGASGSCLPRTAAGDWPRRMDELIAYSERRVRAAIAALPDGRYEAADVLEAPEGSLELRVARHDRRRRTGDRLRGNGGPARGQPQLPPRGHRVGVLRSSSAS